MSASGTLAVQIKKCHGIYNDLEICEIIVHIVI